ncbi:hypothetical protein M231_06796, partial [Tremella mesenterica]
ILRYDAFELYDSERSTVSADESGRTYAELDELFERRVPARKFKDAVTLAEAVGIKYGELVTHKPVTGVGADTA